MPASDRILTSSSPSSDWEAWVESWCGVLQQPPRGLSMRASTGNSLGSAGTGAVGRGAAAELAPQSDTHQRETHQPETYQPETPQPVAQQPEAQQQPDLPKADRVPSAPQALIFAPHPDDECIVGALPLRLHAEAGWQVTNVAVTLGSRQERRAERLAELQAACEVLGFGLHLLSDEGFEQVKPEAATGRTPLWQEQVAQVADLLRTVQPALVLVPHAGDGIPTHIGVHALVSEALAQARINTVVAWTEFWATQAAPNLLVETGVTDTARLVRALSCHHGEIARNPYHLRLPAWMADNVRRGGELLAGPGETPPPFGFATLYRLSRWVDGQPHADLPPRMVTCEDPFDAETLLFTH